MPGQEKSEPPIASIENQADPHPSMVSPSTANQDQTTKESTQDRHHDEVGEAKKEEDTLQV